MEKYEYNSKCKHRTGVRTTKEKEVEIMQERKYELINELAIATAKGDYDTMEELACELYEVYGWYGKPYYC